MPMQVIVLTATVLVPPGTPIVRIDPLLRLRDYQQALEFYTSFIGHGIDRIVFAENTGFDLKPLHEIADARNVASSVDFISFRGNDFPPEYGRAFGEATILDEVMRDERCLRYPADTIYWKSTGRYKVTNLDRMMKTMPQGVQLYCDLRRRGEKRWADMRFMSWTRRGYEAFLAGISQAIREDIRNFSPAEMALFDLLEARFSTSPLRYARSFTTEPFIDGARAEDNRNWSLGRQRLVYYARTIQRKALDRVVF